jgi:hypothetical protein
MIRITHETLKMRAKSSGTAEEKAQVVSFWSGSFGTLVGWTATGLSLFLGFLSMVRD